MFYRFLDLLVVFPLGFCCLSLNSKIMVESDSHPPNSPVSLFYTKGQEVEVSSDEDGFRGAWYPATIIESLTKSAFKKRKKIMVEYKTLLTDDGSAPLTEHVDTSHVRPLPPKATHQGFQENDAIEANHRDGWWTGIVRKVLESNKYRVFFDNPPEIIDFDGKDLRPHLEWIDGNWIAPKKEQTTGSVFSSGTKVEVNIDKENVHDAWFPAVVIKENGDDTFLVKYQISGNCDESDTKVIVDSLHIRPTPPRYADKNYELLEKVDAQYNFGWRPGVITKLLAGRKYNVFFKQGNEDKERHHSEIRPHMEWIDGKWICKSKELVVASDGRKHLRKCDANNSTNDSDMFTKRERSGTDESKTNEQVTYSATIKNLIEQSIHSNENSPSHVLPPSKKVKLTAPDSTGVCSRSSKNSIDEADANSPLVEIPIETSIKETFFYSAFPRTGGKRTRSTRKSAVGDQISDRIQDALAGKTAVDDQTKNRLLIRIKDLPKKVQQKKVAEVDSFMAHIVPRKGRSSKSPFRISSAADFNKAVDVGTQDFNEREDNTKDEIPVVIGLQARGMNHPDLDSPSQLSGEETLKLIRDQTKNDSGGKFMVLNQHKHGGSFQRRKRGRPRKLIIISSRTSETGKEDHGIQHIANELIVKDHTTIEPELPLQTKMDSAVPQVASREKTAEVPETDGKTKEVDMAIDSVSNDTVDDQPLSTWIGGTHSSASTEEPRLSSARPNGSSEARARHADVAIGSSSMDAQEERMPDGNHCLPFVKKSMVWKTIESLEIFKIMPQKPHFRPLADCKEEYREGTAIGIMVTFASLFEKITSLRFEDSKSILESTLESLIDLEKHGFDVTMPRDRVNQLLSIKDKKDMDEILNELKDIERRVEERSDERRKLDSKMDEIQRKIQELKEQLAASKSEIEKKDKEILELHLQRDSARGIINEVMNDFVKIASAPWKLS